VLVPRGDEEQLGVRLGLATTVAGAEAGLTEALVALAEDRAEVRAVTSEQAVIDDGAPDPESVVVLDGEPEQVSVAVGVPVLTRAADEPELTVVIEDLASVSAVEPEIGPELATARRRLRLTVDQVADRTRIRPHVIEAIEIDDFAPCGGDFYARGHLRTLARVLGMDVDPLLETYDAKYADAPLDPRCVFEAELATAGRGPIRGVRGGPNWSVLVASVMTVVLFWSVARLVMDHPVAVTPAPPSLADGSAGLTSGGQLAPPVPVVLTAAGGGARVVLRDGGGKVVFTGPLAFGQSQTFAVSPPVRVQSTDGSLEVTVDGQEHGALGKTGQPAQDVFTAR
jgi:transcriptional regulator with XRE-family HTH domain